MIEDLNRLKDQELIAMIDALMDELKSLDVKSAEVRETLLKYTNELSKRTRNVSLTIQGF